MHKFIVLFTLILLAISCKQSPNKTDAWPLEKAGNWYTAKGWLRGCNFIPSTAVNQLEMWQKETFDTATINRELGYAEGIGYNSVRVFLHHLVWKLDAKGFKNRINNYLTIAEKHHISTIFVFFDDCWDSTYHFGNQPAPRTGIHNSGWIQDPGLAIYQQPKLTDTLEHYVKDILSTFKNDPRILMWDLYNEPGNSGNGTHSLTLLKEVFRWAREVNPSQPLTSGLFTYTLPELNDFQLKHSDIISYHNYFSDTAQKETIASLKTFGRPVICTEYMARILGSRFDNVMPLLKKEHVGAYNWGLVKGKTNTIFAWDVPVVDGKEPAVWFHDIFYEDGRPYDSTELRLIKSLTQKL
ncbi:1,4-beta-xylanase [Chitinophaga silvatica]|uniref:1,4-beta-xylanase n=1 Tax=Chitinophaga silvatica TaxID=2282649 RepID=A0A3E1Y816_9BACT|nr:glycoside hydrolase family 2 TIM barrel-domain containing protein [Chitinophaga silvatica]RFS21352.1 1,4-beta-xylanase [Chitinophaga silvatica]